MLKIKYSEFCAFGILCFRNMSIRDFELSEFCAFGIMSSEICGFRNFVFGIFGFGIMSFRIMLDSYVFLELLHLQIIRGPMRPEGFQLATLKLEGV